MSFLACRRSGQSEELRQAISTFPISTWMRERMKVYDTGGKNIQADCPVCLGKAKLGVSRFKKVAQCFKCSDGGAGGSIWNGRADLIKLIRLVEKCDYRTALQTIFRSSGIAEPVWRREEQIDRGIPEDAIPLWETSPLHPSRKELARRGMDHLSAISHVCVTGPYEGRVILPAMWFDEVDAWEAKAYMSIKPKSLFPDWFETGHSIYTTRKWDTNADFAIVTESIFDAETFGINALGLYGSTLHEGQVIRLLSLAARGIKRLVWALDFDAWKKQAKAILSWTEMHFQNLVAPLPAWSDPNSLGWARCWELVQNAHPVSDATDIVLFGLDR